MPITPTDANQTYTLNGHNLTVSKLVAIARYGAKVQLSKAARQRSLNAYYLLLEGSREGVPIYWFNRAPGAGRQDTIFSGDPLSTQVTSDSPTCPSTGNPCSNRQYLLETSLSTFKSGAQGGEGPPVASEEIVRAMMAERVNTMSYEAATPQLTQMLIDLLNKDVTPVVESRGSPGEGDLPQMGNVEATMVGAGQAYYHGVKMPASEALARAGLRPLQDQPAQNEAPGAPFAADDAALTSTNAFSVGQAALLDYDAQSMLNWQDLIYAMELDGMNSSVTPISAPVQLNRPFTWINGDASRVLNEISGSYLFNIDQTNNGVPVRIIQDPESLRALSQRDGSAWEAWAALDKDLLTQMNSSDHNPAVTPGYSPTSSPELNTPWFKQYYVKGGPDDSACVGGGVGPATGCQHGYIMSNANWDPYPLDNDIEAFTNALANIAVNDDMVPLRFENTFFTVISPDDPSLPSAQLQNSARGADDYTLADLMAEIQTLQNPVPAQGNSIVFTVEDLQAESRIKVAKARLMVDDLSWLQGQDLLTATQWMNIRQIQGQALGFNRSFGAGPTAAWQAFRTIVPWQSAVRPDVPAGTLAYDFLQANPATQFYPPAASPPSTARTTSVSLRRLRPAIRAAKARTTRYRHSARVHHGGLRSLAFEPELAKGRKAAKQH
ncbi:MAG TPA: aromatic amino acid ammonia-lyase [Solirubrobacteraceae bacterium]|nr:aromatic amino acid ammonia-lyase [Solirubrobacteraceae bacterium]